MDVNIVFECIGYGATRAVASTDFPRTGSRVPALFILQTAPDPVDYCVEAYMKYVPESCVQFDTRARTMILDRLQREAGFTRH